MTGTRAISLHQPHATLFAIGVRTIETRSWPAPAGAVGERILIHAAAKDVEGRCAHDGRRMDWHGDSWSCPLCGDEWTPSEDWWNYGADALRPPLPLGAIVASATLAACVPMIENIVSFPDSAGDREESHLALDPEYSMRAHLQFTDPKGWGGWAEPVDVTDQLPYGDFEDGRWAWLLEDVKPTTERCPACWGSAVRDIPVVQVGGAYRDPSDRREQRPCPTCSGSGRCDPVPAKGAQRIWRWTP